MTEEIQKKGFILPFTWEDVALPSYFNYDPELNRKGHSVPRVIPADEQARYEAALAAYKVLEDYEHTEWGGPDYGTEVLPPPDTEWVWDETEEEYEARIAELRKRRGNLHVVPVYFTVPGEENE